MNKDKKHQTADSIGSMYEPGEESLANLIKEAGKTAREQKKMMLEAHFKKIRLAVTGQLADQQ